MELKRIFTNRKMIFLTLLLLILTAGLFLWAQFNNATAIGYSLTDRIEYTKEIVNLARRYDADEAHDILSDKLSDIYDETESDSGVIEYDSSLEYKIEVLEEQISSLEHILSYEEYLQGIIDNSNNLTAISIFQNTDSFASLNLEKTKNDYEKLQGTEVRYGNYSAVSAVMNYDIVHYIIFLFIFIVVWYFFEDEKKGLKSIFYATKNGRFGMALHRIGVLGVSSVIYTFLSYTLLFLCSFTLYGGIEDINNSIQSMEEFKDCLFNVTVLQYIFIYVLIHVVITFAMSLFVWMILLIFRNKLLSLGLLIIIVGGEAVLNFALINQSAVVFLKYENLYYFINPSEILNSYRNYMLFGHIVNCFRLFMITVVVVFIICAVICTAISVKRKPSADKTKPEIMLMKAVKRINAFYQYIIAKLSITGTEIYKVLIVRKGIVFIVIWLYMIMSAVDTTSVYYMGNSVLMKEIYDGYSGPVDEGLQDYVDENKALLEQLDEEYEQEFEKYEAGLCNHEELEKIENKLTTYESLRACLDTVEKKLAYINNLKEEKDIDAWFLYDKGYKIMWTGDGLYTGAGYTSQETNALFAVILLILLLSTVFSYDRSCGMQNMLHATSGGREKLFHKKIKMSVIFCFVICLVTYGIELYEVNKIYPLTCLNAPVQSLEFMEKFPLKISILAFIIMAEVIHFISLLAISMIIYMFSLYFKGYYSVIVSFVVLVVPSLLFMLGVEWCGYISVIQPVIYVEALQEQGFVYSIIILLIEITAGAVCYFITKKRFCDR